MTTGFISKQRTQKLRLLIFGLPDMGKTTSLNSFDTPHDIIVCPGEKGIDTLPQRDDVKTHIYNIDDEGSKPSYLIIKEFHEVLMEIAHSKSTYTMSIEGAHKLYEYYIDIATQGAYLAGKDFEATLYAQAHRLFSDLLNKLFFSPAPIIIWTSWAELEYKEEQLTREERKYKRRYYYPALPGKMSKAILGEFGGKIYCDIGPQCAHGDCPTKKEKKNSEKDHYLWQLNPYGEVRGVGFKLPPGSKPLPTYIHQSWQILKPLLLERGVNIPEPR